MNGEHKWQPFAPQAWFVCQIAMSREIADDRTMIIIDDEGGWENVV